MFAAARNNDIVGVRSAARRADLVFETVPTAPALQRGGRGNRRDA